MANDAPKTRVLAAIAIKSENALAYFPIGDDAEAMTETVWAEFKRDSAFPRGGIVLEVWDGGRKQEDIGRYETKPTRKALAAEIEEHWNRIRA